ncbi:hypothetical protein IJ579_07530 [bacterium]|nr:hypothetical protein [bacterium]
MPITTKVTAQTFQDFDGTNFTTTGADYQLVKFENGSLGAYTGIGTDFTDATGVILDLKGSMGYGNSIFSGGFRLRHNIGESSQTVQLRLQPATLTVPLGKKIDFYATPYEAAKLNYGTGKIDFSTGIYSGISFQAGKARVFIEGQLYDVTAINPETTGINAGVTIPLGKK